MARSSNNSGPQNGNWRGGRSVASNGYVLVRVGVGHHLADVRGYAYEHRINAEKLLGRRLQPGEQVHHIDHNKMNNSLDNLEVTTGRKHHAFRHRRAKRDEPLRLPGESNPEIECACGCGKRFMKFDGTGRPRRFVSGHNADRDPQTGRMKKRAGRLLDGVEHNGFPGQVEGEGLK